MTILETYHLVQRIDRMSNKQFIVILLSGRDRMDVEHFRDLQILH